MRDISVDESEELPQILHSLVTDSPAAVSGRSAGREGGGAESADGVDPELLTEAIRMGAPALMKLQVRVNG